MKIADLDRLNDCANFIYEAGVTVTPVTFPEASELLSATQKLTQICERLNLDQNWSEFARLNKILYYRIASSICPPSYVWSKMEVDLKSIYQEIKLSASGVTLEVRQVFDQITLPDTGLWDRIIKIDCSPFYQSIKDKYIESKKRNQTSLIFILNDNLLREKTIQLLNWPQDSINLEVCKSNELRVHNKVDRVFYIGSMHSLRGRNEEFLLRAPVTDEFDFFELCHSGKLQNTSLDIFSIAPGDKFLLNKAAIIGAIEDVKPLKTTQVADYEFESKEYLDPSELAIDSRSVDSYRAILGGGFGTNFNVESNVFIAHCRNQGTSLICINIDKKNVIDLEPGDLVVLTTEGSGDMIAPYADQLIGPKAKTYRELQLAWKKDLTRLLTEIGLPSVIEQLKLNSGFDVSQSNLRQWTGQTVHGPGKERPLLFDAVLKLVKRGDKISIHHDALNQIRDASIKAGHQLQSELRKKLHGMDLSVVISHGFMKFRVDFNGPAKTIFELQKLDATVRSMNPHHMNRVFTLKNEITNT